MVCKTAIACEKYYNSLMQWHKQNNVISNDVLNNGNSKRHGGIRTLTTFVVKTKFFKYCCHCEWNNLQFSRK